MQFPSQTPGMATQGQNIYSPANNFEAKVFNYMSGSNADQSRLKDDVSVIKTWVSEQMDDAATAAKNKQQIESLAKVFVTATGAIDKLSSDDPVDIIEGCLGIIGSITELIDGPPGIVAGAICAILGGLLSASKKLKPDIVTQLHQVVHAELLKFHQTVQNETFAGLKLRITVLMATLNTLSPGDNGLPGFDNLSSDIVQFVGEMANSMDKPLSLNSSNDDEDDVVHAMVVYALLQTSVQSMLTAVISKFQAVNLDAQHVITTLTTLRMQTQCLSFLSDNRYTSFAGALEDGKLFKMLNLRQHLTAYRTVEAFRHSNGMTTMATIEILQSRSKSFVHILSRGPCLNNTRDDLCRYREYDGILIVNDTEFPLKVKSGIVGDHINNLEFTEDIPARHKYQRVANGFWSSNFSAGGYLVLYLDGNTQPDEAPFEGNCKVITFSLSSPFWGCIKSKIMDKTDSVKDIGECWRTMQSNDMTPIFWVHNGKHYVAHGVISKRSYTNLGWYAPPPSVRGRWCYSIHEFDPDAMLEPNAAVYELRD